MCFSRLHGVLTSVAVVIGVAGHQSSPVKVGGEDERLLPQPADHSLDLKASAFIQKDLEGTRRTFAPGYRSWYRPTHLRLQLPLVQRRFLSQVGEGVGEVPVQVNAVLVEPGTRLQGVSDSGSPEKIDFIQRTGDNLSRL